MKYTEAKPTGFLSHFVQCFWRYENTGAVEHTILPDGYFDLIAEFDSEVLTTVKRTGIWTQATMVSIPKNTTIFAIRFKLLANECFFQQSIQSILNTTENLPLSFWNLQTYQHTDFERFVSDITHRLECVIQGLQKIDNRKLKLFELIYQQNESTVKEISEQVFWSARQINRYFNHQFGISLKEFLNIVRCNASYQGIADGKLSPQYHFFDQPHWIKALKKYTGVTPKVLYKNENDRFLQLLKTKRR